MNRTQIVALANAIQSVRPDWQQAGIVAHLTVLAASWAGSDAAMFAHAMTVAASPQAITPGAFNVTPPETAEPYIPPQTFSREPTCHVCSRTRSKCREYQMWEYDHGLPDVHEFETLDDAKRRMARRTA